MNLTPLQTTALTIIQPSVTYDMSDIVDNLIATHRVDRGLAQSAILALVDRNLLAFDKDLNLSLAS